MAVCHKGKEIKEKKLKKREKAVCYLCNAVTTLSCLAVPFLTIYASTVPG
jgi:hypothetical protein